MNAVSAKHHCGPSCLCILPNIRVDKFRTCQNECTRVWYGMKRPQHTLSAHKASQEVHLHTHPLWAASLGSGRERNDRSSSEPSCCEPHMVLCNTQAHMSLTPRGHQRSIKLGGRRRGGGDIWGHGGGRGVGDPCHCHLPLDFDLHVTFMTATCCELCSCF